MIYNILIIKINFKIRRKIKNEYTYTYFWMQAQSI